MRHHRRPCLGERDELFFEGRAVDVEVDGGRPISTRWAPTKASNGPWPATWTSGPWRWTRVTPGSVYSVRTSSSASVNRTVDAPPSSSTIAAGVPSATTWPASHHDDAVAQPLGFLDVVGDEHDRRAAVADAADHVPGMTPADRVEVLGQLVEEHQLRVADESEGDEQPLPLAAGQRAERPCPQAGEVPLLGELAERSGRGVQRGEQPQGLADPQLVGERGVLELGAELAAEAIACRGRIEAEHASPTRSPPVAGPGGSRRSSSCRPRSCRAGRTARHARRRTTRRGGPRRIRSACRARRLPQGCCWSCRDRALAGASGASTRGMPDVLHPVGGGRPPAGQFSAAGRRGRGRRRRRSPPPGRAPRAW